MTDRKLSTVMWSHLFGQSSPPSATMMLLVVLSTVSIAIDNFLATTTTPCASSPMILLGQTPSSCLSMRATLATTASLTLSLARPQHTQQTDTDDAFSSAPLEPMSHSYSLWLFDHHAMIVLSRAGRPLLPVHDAFILGALLLSTLGDAFLVVLITMSRSAHQRCVLIILRNFALADLVLRWGERNLFSGFRD